MSNIKNMFLNANNKQNSQKSLQPVLKKLKQIVLRQYNCELEYFGYLELKKKYQPPLIKKLENNEIEIHEGISLFPLFVGQKLVGAAEITSDLPLSDKVINRIYDITKTIIESALVDLDRMTLIDQLEYQLELLSDTKNIVRIESFLKKNESADLQKTNFYEINVPCLIQGDSLEDIIKLTQDIHSLSHRYAILPLSQIDNNQEISAEDFKRLGPITIFIPNIISLNKSQITALNKYLGSDISKDQPMIISGITTPLNEAKNHIGDELFKKISVSFIQLEKNYDFYSNKPILDLLLKQAFIDSSPKDITPVN